MSENGVSGARLGSSPKPDQVAGAQMGDVHYLSCSHMQWSCLLDRTNLSWEELGNFWGEAAEATNRAGITAKRQRGPGRRGGGGPSREATPTRLLSAHDNALGHGWPYCEALSVMSLKRLRRNGKARQKPASPTQMVVAAAQHGLRLCWLAWMRLWDLPHHCCKHLMTLKLVWSALSAGITAPDIILRNFNAQLFEPSRDRIHRPTGPIKIRWPRASDKIWPVQQPLACCVLPITMIDCRKKRQTDLWIGRVAQFCSTSLGLSLRLVGSRHARCLHTLGLRHRQTYLKNFHVLDEEPCNIAAQTLRRPLLRPCRSDGACSLAYCRRATCPGTMKEFKVMRLHLQAPIREAEGCRTEHSLIRGKRRGF